MFKNLNISKGDLVSIILGGLVTIAIDILLRSGDNNARQEEIAEEVTKQLNERSNNED